MHSTYMIFYWQSKISCNILFCAILINYSFREEEIKIKIIIMDIVRGRTIRILWLVMLVSDLLRYIYIYMTLFISKRKKKEEKKIATFCAKVIVMVCIHIDYGMKV